MPFHRRVTSMPEFNSSRPIEPGLNGHTSPSSKGSYFDQDQTDRGTRLRWFLPAAVDTHTADMQQSIESWRRLSEKQRASFETERESWRCERILLEDHVRHMETQLFKANRRIEQLQARGSGATRALNGARFYAQPRVNSAPDVRPPIPERRHPPSSQLKEVASLQRSRPWEQEWNSPAVRAAAGLNYSNGSNSNGNTIHNGSSDQGSHLPLHIATAAHHDRNSLSPFPLHAVSSPPPESYRLHAGHTPRATSFGPLSPPLVVGTPGTSGLPPLDHILQNDGVGDEDPPLKGPLVLDNRPENALDMLHALEERLQDVKDHPEQSTPAVLQGAANPRSPSDGSDDTVKPDKRADQAKEEPPSKSSERIDDGIRLRLKPSMNFGAPFGSLKTPRSSQG